MQAHHVPLPVALEAAVGGKIELLSGYNSIPPDLAGKVRELCEEATNDCHPRTLGHLAREVLAMMEER